MKVWEKKNFKSRLIKRMIGTHPLILLRVVFTAVILFPAWIVTLTMSLFQASRWKQTKRCRAFVADHKLAFPEVLPETLEIEMVSSGLSNLNMAWTMKSADGTVYDYFVKVFLPLGSLWATVNAMTSPFPAVRGSRSHERFMVDMVSRTLLAERGISVPKLIAFDCVDRVMVTERIEGPMVDDLLKESQGSEILTEEVREVIRECGSGLGKIHAEGFSLIDTQPVNCMWVKERKRVYFVDLEFCTRSDERIWDVGFFLSFLTVRLNKGASRDARRLFLENYRKYRASDIKEIMSASGRLKDYIPVFQTILDIREMSPEKLLEEILA